MDGFADKFNSAYQTGLGAKLGLFSWRDGDHDLAQELLTAMAKGQVDFTLAFRRLSDAAIDPANLAEVRRMFTDPAAFDEWAGHWRLRIAAEPQDAATRRDAMRAVNPGFIPRNHRVEAVIEAAVNRDDFGPFEQLLTVLAKPYQDQPEFSHYADPPEPHERVLETFCGT